MNTTRAWIRLLLSGAICALIVAGCSSDTRVVPKVTGADDDVYSAYERLSREGFKVEVTDDFRTGSCECDNGLIEQWPVAGTKVKRGSVVEITVGGPGQMGSYGYRQPAYRQMFLPKLVGLRLDAVDRWLGAHDLGWSADLPALPASKGRDLLAAYVVRKQEPKAGEYVESGDSVDIVAAPASDLLAQWRTSTVVVPHVNGDRDVVTAYDRLHARGLAVATDRRLVRGPYILVIAQRPAAGTRVRRGTTVTLSLDPKVDHRRLCCGGTPLYTMRNFVGRNLGKASEWLDARYLTWTLDAPALPPTNTPRMLDAYVVTSQKPAPGSKVPESIPPGSGDESKPIELRAKLVR